MQDLKVFLAKWRRVAAITPYYMANGRTGSIVRYDNHDMDYYNCRCERLMEALAEKFHVSLEQARYRSAAWLGKGCLRKPPLVLHENLCFIQVKCRQEIRRNSGTIGYVVLQKVADVHFHHSGGAQILFRKKGAPLETTQKIESVHKQLAMGNLLLEQYRQERLEQIRTLG